MTEKEKSHAGMLYQPGDPELVSDRDITIKKLYDYNRLNPLDRNARQIAIRELLGKTGDNCVVEQPLFSHMGIIQWWVIISFLMSIVSSWTVVKSQSETTCSLLQMSAL